MTERIQIVGGRFVSAGRDYGSATDILAYPGEELHLGTEDGVTRCKTPHDIDLLLALGNRVAGCEVKTPLDLLSSWSSRRLQRQLRTIRASCDVTILVIRGGIRFGDLEVWTGLFDEAPDKFWEDLLNLQTLGVYIMPVPHTGYIDRLYQARRALTTQGFRAVAGTDQVQRERRPGWLLRRIPSIGAQRSKELIARFHSTWSVFQAARCGRVAQEFGPAVERKIKQALEE